MTASLNGHPLTKFMYKQHMLLAELDRDTTCYRLRKGREAATRKNGGKYVAGPKAKYPKELKTRIRRLRKRSGWSYRRIADTLNQEGVKPQKAERWSTQLVRAISGS